MSRDWQKDMERVQLGRKMYKTYGAVVEGMDPKESLDEVLIYWLQQYAAEKERGDKLELNLEATEGLTRAETKRADGWREHVRKLNINLEYAEAREQKLREAIQTVIEMKELNPEQMATDQKGLYDAAMWFLSGIMDSLYPKEETKP